MRFVSVCLLHHFTQCSPFIKAQTSERGSAHLDDMDDSSILSVHLFKLVLCCDVHKVQDHSGWTFVLFTNSKQIIYLL